MGNRNLKRETESNKKWLNDKKSFNSCQFELFTYIDIYFWEKKEDDKGKMAKENITAFVFRIAKIVQVNDL